jgi:nucleotidyltransferase/DNA polymerase involved in DNA repair
MRSAMPMFKALWGWCGDAAGPRRRRHHADRPARRRYRRVGARLGRLARGEDAGAVDAHAPADSISAETTLGRDEADAEGLAHTLGALSERPSVPLKQASRATGTVTLSSRPPIFATRSRHFADPTQLAEIL